MPAVLQERVRQVPFLVWGGGFICVIAAVGTLAIVASLAGSLHFDSPPAVVAAEQSPSLPRLSGLPDRADCAEIGKSDLRSPREGLWFEGNCLEIPAERLVGQKLVCNRASLNPAEFTEVSPDLFVFRQMRGAQAYLWYSSAEACYDLVSSRLVIAVCADQTVTFKSDARSACSGHGGILAWVNGR